MSLANTRSHYGSVSKTFHWLTALLILTLIPLGIFANDLPYDTSEALARKAWYFSLHKTLGVTVFFVALARILWAASQPKPIHLHPGRKLETLAAATVHWLLYGSLLLVPLSGWVHHAATEGFAPIWWPLGQTLPLVPKSAELASVSAGLHIVFERVLLVSILLHVAGAVKHHVVDRDVTLRRMLPGTPAVPNVSGDTRSSAPVALAVSAWAIALAVGAGLGLYSEEDDGLRAAVLEAVRSDWVVEDGQLQITVLQMGSGVTGTFADWTAAIRFDESIEEGVAGSVDVVVAIGSLTLGNVTSQALGPDFFNAEGFPTATFAADILRGPDGYSAQGTVTIKEQTMPVSLPFTLTLEDGLALMQGQNVLDRRDFDIGESQTNEGTLGFEVQVSVELTARDTP